MSDYTINYSFAGFQSLNPDEPMPAGELDVEFQGIEAALNDIAEALSDVRRGDGKLQNGVATWDALDLDVRNRISRDDPGVTVPDLTDSAFAEVSEAEAGLSNDKLMTPLTTSHAIGAQRPFANQTEAEAGEAEDKVLSPARGTDLVNSLRGFASTAEAEGAEAEDKVLSPATGKVLIDALRFSATATVNLSWATVEPGESSQQSISVPGARPNDRVLIGLPNNPSSLIPDAWVAENDVVMLRLSNLTTGIVTPHDGNTRPYAVTVVRF